CLSGQFGRIASKTVLTPAGSLFLLRLCASINICLYYTIFSLFFNIFFHNLQFLQYFSLWIFVFSAKMNERGGTLMFETIQKIRRDLHQIPELELNLPKTKAYL